MSKTYHLISGLPRSGTTLLSTILKQNPQFEASISGPLARFVRAIIQESSSQGGYRFECPIEKREKIIKSMFDTYYDDPTKQVAFNTNRGWGLLLPAMKKIYPDIKVIMCVRDIGWILDSFETLIRKNPLNNTSMFSVEENTNVYTRCETLLRSDRTLGFAYNSLKQAITSEHRQSILILEYENFAKQPERAMKTIYTFLGFPYFEHDFNDVEASYDEFDEDIQLPGLHTTRKQVKFIERPTIIPPDIWNMVKNMEVWRQM